MSLCFRDRLSPSNNVQSSGRLPAAACLIQSCIRQEASHPLPRLQAALRHIGTQDSRRLLAEEKTGDDCVSIDGDREALPTTDLARDPPLDRSIESSIGETIKIRRKLRSLPGRSMPRGAM
jgi:hypothetical protein